MTRPCTLSLALLAFSSLAAALAIADPPAETHKVLRWEKDATSAYQKAIEQKKPLVVVFVCPLQDEKCVHCKRFRASVFADEVGKLTEEAIYVMAEIDTKKDNRSPDHGAQALFGRLGCKQTPTVTILEPHPTMIAEIARLNGYFNAPDLARHCRDVISKWRDGGSKLTKAEKN